MLELGADFSLEAYHGKNIWESSFENSLFRNCYVTLLYYVQVVEHKLTFTGNIQTYLATRATVR